MSEGDRPYDVVVWGATGFTGRLVAGHLAETAADDLDWAIAGRDQEALEALRRELVERGPGGTDPGVLAGDAREPASLDAIASSTRVVCATVGPFSRYGTPMVEACLDGATDYCDISGEVNWMHRMVEAHHETARERGIRLVHACGFDSVPSDCGVLAVQSFAEDAYGAPCSAIRTYARTGSMAFSGGTAASISQAYAEAAADPETRRVLADARSLAGDGVGETRGPPSPRPFGRDAAIGQWTAPFVWAQVNEKLVHRTNALLGYVPVEAFDYGEVSATGEGLRGAVRAGAITAGLGLFGVALSVGPLRRLVDRYVLPDPGTGPDRSAREAGSFEFRFHGTGTSPETGEAFAVVGRVAGDCDPYTATGRIAAEAARCLAEGDVESPLDGGVLSPAAGIGPPLVDRLEDVGFTFEAERVSGGRA